MIVSCRSLACHFGGIKAVDGVDLDLDAGSCVAVVGGNGSGKSTLLDLLSGLRTPTGGSITVDGRPVAPNAAAFTSRGVRRSFQEPRLVAGLSVDENIALGVLGRTHPVLGVPRSPRPRETREVGAARRGVGLEVAGWRPVTVLSYGERKRVELARVLASAPRVALLDEPLAGVAGDDRSALLAGIAGLAASGTAVVLVEHDTTAVAEVADRILVLERGRVVAGQGRPAGGEGPAGVGTGGDSPAGAA